MKPRTHLIPHGDKLVHFTFYFVAVILGVFFLRELTKANMKFFKARVIMGCSMVIFGLVIEVMQHMFTLNRSGDIYDAIANSIGVICGIAAVNYLFSKRRTLKWEI